MSDPVDWSQVEVVTGDDTHMAQVYRLGTSGDHSPVLCWCRPRYQFTPGPGMLLGAVIHR